MAQHIMSVKSFVNSLHLIVRGGALKNKMKEKEKEEGKLTLEYFYVELL
jgi:hypothetical protein